MGIHSKPKSSRDRAASSVLQKKAGLIRYGSGRLRMTDRPGLEAVSCECYGVARRAYDNLMGSSAEAKPSCWR